MSISNSYPTQRPKLNLVFNGGSDQLDSRISYTRSSSGTAFSAERHLSSENFLKYSNDLSNADWNKARVTVGSTNNTAPDGSSTASSVLETAVTDTHTFYDQYTSVAGVSYTHTVFAKANGRTKFKLYTRDSNATFDLTAVTATTTGMDAVSVTAIGSTGWYKCVATEAATNTLGILQIELMDGTATNYAGDVTKGMYFWGMQASSTGETVLNATSGSIHREFAPTLKTAAADAPRFEYASDGQSVGTALGLLVESQATNLARYSSDISSWNSTSTVELTSNAGIAPNGQLEADLIVFPSTATQHYVYDNTISMTSGTTYTTSVYVKSAGQRYFQLCGNSAGFGYTGANFDLQAVSSVNINSTTSTITAIGSGWYRLTVTMAAAATTTGGVILIGVGSSTAAQFAATAGDDYSGVLCWGFQTEVGSAASSLISTSGAAATKSADICQLVSEPLLDNGSGGLTVEYDMRDASDTAYVLQLERSVGATNGGGVAVTNRYLFVENTYEDLGNTSSNVFHKVAASWESGSQKASRDGGAIVEDTATVVPSNVNTLHIGTRQDGQEPVNGHIRNIAIYSEPLTSTNLTTLSQI
tara:strand:- start:1399 stop:3162 length:1764 start_codon:yes stop_codon:yes gene_type:complete